MEEVPDSGGLGLLGPATILLRAKSLLGPLSILGRTDTLSLPETTITLVGAEDAAVELATIGTAPCREADTGADVRGDLLASASTTTVARGERVRLTLSGSAPARPGRYAGALRLASASGRSLVIPIAIEISTIALWGIGFVLLGLVAAGLLAELTTESNLRAKQVEVLRERQMLREQLDSDRIARSEDGDVAEIDRDYAAAIGALAKPPPLSFADHRLSDAGPYLAAAASLRIRLAQAMTGHVAGDAEIDDLRARWKTYTDIATDLQRLVPAAPSVPSSQHVSAADLPAEIDAYMGRFARRFLSVELGYDAAQLQEVVLGVRLAAASGKIEEAHKRSVAAADSIEASLDALSRARDTVERQRLLGFNLGSNARQVAEALAAEKLPAEDVSRIGLLLDEAATTLATPAPTGHDDDLAFQAANHLVNTAATEMTRARATASSKAFKEAIRATDDETGMADIEAVNERLKSEPHSTPEQKKAAFHIVIDAWHRKLEALPDTPARREMQAKAASALSAIDAGDRSAAVKRYTELTDLFAAWGSARVISAGAAAIQPFCIRYKQLTSVRIAQISETLRQMEPRPEHDTWERTLTGLRTDLQDIDPRQSSRNQFCIAPLSEIDRRVVALSGAIFRAETENAPISPAARLAAIRQAGLPEGTFSNTRSLTLFVATAEPERLIDRDIHFELQGIDPNWNENDLAHVDFGDGTAPFVASLHAIQHGTRIVHRYETFAVHQAKVVVTKDERTGEPSAPILGEGHASISVSPSLIPLAQHAADLLFNVRFALALLIAGTIYTWRFHAGKKVFGENGFDYVEAFALGFVVSMAIANLPERISDILLK